MKKMDSLLKDIRYGLRSVLKHKGFTLIAVLTIALGVGANTAIFTVINGVLLKALPFPEPQQLIALTESSKEVPVMAVSYPNYLDWRAQQTTLENMAARLPAGGILTGGGEPERITGRLVNASFFATLGVQPHVGRFFNDQEDKPGGDRVMVLALLLGAIGLYGVMAYHVTQRTREIGIRMALGAQRANVGRLIVKQAMTLAFVAVAIGLAGSWALTRLMRSLLFEVSATDPIAFLTPPVVLTLIALAACYIPARRATRVDPLVALRYE